VNTIYRIAVTELKKISWWRGSPWSHCLGSELAGRLECKESPVDTSMHGALSSKKELCDVRLLELVHTVPGKVYLGQWVETQLYVRKIQPYSSPGIRAVFLLAR